MDPWFRKIPSWFRRRKWQCTPVLSPGKSHGWRSSAGYSPWGHRESDTTEWLHFCVCILLSHLFLCFVKLAKFSLIRMLLPTTDFPCDSAGKESTCRKKLKKRIHKQCRRPGSIHRLGRCPGEGKGYPLQYSCWDKPMDRGAWQATVHGVTESQTRLSD